MYYRELLCLRSASVLREYSSKIPTIIIGLFIVFVIYWKYFQQVSSLGLYGKLEQYFYISIVLTVLISIVSGLVSKTRITVNSLSYFFANTLFDNKQILFIQLLNQYKFVYLFTL